MGRFVNSENGVIVSVDDSKDDRFASPLWEAQAAEKPAPKRSASRKSNDSE